MLCAGTVVAGDIMARRALVRAAAFNRRGFGLLCAAALVFGLAGEGPTWAQEDGSNVKVPKYKPMNRGAPGGRIGGATRGTPPESLKLLALAPDHVAYTSQNAPVLYWYLSAPIAKAVFSLREVDGAVPAVIKNLSDTTTKGVHPIALADLGLILDPEKVYEWSISLAGDQTKDVSALSRGLIPVRPAPVKLARQIEKAKPAEVPDFHATNGYWYDAIDAVSKLIAAQPEANTFKQMRAGLVEQVKLFDVADYDRGEM